MEHKQNYSIQRAEESEFHLRIPEGPVPSHRGGFIELRGGAGHHSYQQYAGHCLTEQGGIPGLDEFKAKFTAWSLEGAGGVVLYPEGPAFKVVERFFKEGDAAVTYRADAAHYTALMLCLHPTFFLPGAPSPVQLASYQVLESREPDGPSDIPLVPQKTIDVNGEIFMLKAFHPGQKFSYKIEIISSPTGQNHIVLGGRLGTTLPEST